MIYEMFNDEQNGHTKDVHQWVTVTELPDPIYAEPVVNILENNEIPYCVVTNSINDADPVLTFTQGVQIKVPSSFEATARTLLAQPLIRAKD